MPMKILLQTTARLTTAAALAFSSLSPAGVRAQAATPSLSATQTAHLIDDVDHDGLVDPGDTLRYTLETGANLLVLQKEEVGADGVAQFRNRYAFTRAVE